MLCGRRFGDHETTGGERLRRPIGPRVASPTADHHALALQRVHAGPEHGVGADDAGGGGLEHGLQRRFFHARDVHEQGALAHVRTNGTNHGVGDVDRHADHDDIGHRRRFLGAQRGVGVDQEQAMAQVAEETRHDATDAPVATDDRDGVRRGVHRDFGPECGLMITTRSHEQPKDRLDLLAGQPQFRRVLMSIA